MNKFEKVKTEKQFLSILKRHYKALKKRNMQISYLGLVENAWTRDLDYYFELYFGFEWGGCCYKNAFYDVFGTMLYRESINVSKSPIKRHDLTD